MSWHHHGCRRDDPNAFDPLALRVVLTPGRNSGRSGRDVFAPSHSRHNPEKTAEFTASYHQQDRVSRAEPPGLTQVFTTATQSFTDRFTAVPTVPARGSDG